MTTLTDRMDMFKKYLDRTNMDHKPYQYDGVRWCLENELRSDPICGVRGGFIADEMGLGKTILMIGLMYSNFVRHTLIVVPPILLDQWFCKIYETTGHKAFIFHGASKKSADLEALKSAKIVLTTYGAITLNKKQLANHCLSMLHLISWDRIIFDEAHHLRNSKTTRYISCRLLRAGARWLVSGTPIQNKKDDFYSLCAMLRLPASFYTIPENLIQLTRSFILKRTKKQVGIELPDIRTEKQIVEWESEKEMKLAEELHAALTFSFVSPEKGVNNPLSNSNSVLPTMLRAKQSCIYPKLIAKHMDKLVENRIISDYNEYKEAFDYSSKLTAVINAIVDNRDNGNGKLIFCHYREEIDEISERLRLRGISKVATFDGRTSYAKRCEILDDDYEVIILQIQTGCEGLNLQEKYNEIYFISPHWNPAIEAQAVARCHRIGQKKTVFVKKFEMCAFKSDNECVITRTIDKYICDVQEEKLLIAQYTI